MVTNKERIQANNGELREAIELAKNLPDAGGGESTPTQEKTVDIVANGTVEVIPDEGYALSKVTANVNVPIPEGYIQPRGELEVTENGTHDVTDKASVSVQVPIPEGYVKPSGTKIIVNNGEYNVTDKSSVSVNVPEREIVLQDKTITENGTYSADEGYDGLGSVTVEVASSGGTDTRLKDLAEGTITEIDDESITLTRNYAFYDASSLKRVNLPNVTTLGSYTFNSCESLVSADLPSVTSAIPTYCFTSCSALTYVNTPNATGANNYSFQDTTALEKLDLLGTGSFGSYSFRRSGITALIIRNNTTKLSKLSSSNAFTDCPIENGAGYIYFYREYVESYKAATGWANFAEQIRAIEDYPEITGG